MTKLNLNDLPHSVRKRVEAKLAEQGVTTGPKVARSRTKISAPQSGVDVVCAACGERLTSEPAMKRHMTKTGHSRYEIPLEED